MSDFLLELSKNPTTRKLIKTVGLPVPMPPVLRRAKGPMEDRPLHDHQVIYGATSGGRIRSMKRRLSSNIALSVRIDAWLSS